MHRLRCNRTHIWIFVAANAYGLSSFTQLNCPCSKTTVTWLYTLSDYVGPDYFCVSNQKYIHEGNEFIEDKKNPLWDGQGCGPTISCCEFNNPPYFCKHLNYPTSEDREIRLLSHELIDISITLLLCLS